MISSQAFAANNPRPQVVSISNIASELSDGLGLKVEFTPANPFIDESGASVYEGKFLLPDREEPLVFKIWVNASAGYERVTRLAFVGGTPASLDQELRSIVTTVNLNKNRESLGQALLNQESPATQQLLAQLYPIMNGLATKVADATVEAVENQTDGESAGAAAGRAASSTEVAQNSSVRTGKAAVTHVVDFVHSEVKAAGNTPDGRRARENLTRVANNIRNAVIGVTADPHGSVGRWMAKVPSRVMKVGVKISISKFIYWVVTLSSVWSLYSFFNYHAVLDAPYTAGAVTTQFLISALEGIYIFFGRALGLAYIERLNRKIAAIDQRKIALIESKNPAELTSAIDDTENDRSRTSSESGRQSGRGVTLGSGEIPRNKLESVRQIFLEAPVCRAILAGIRRIKPSSASENGGRR